MSFSYKSRAASWRGLAILNSSLYACFRASTSSLFSSLLLRPTRFNPFTKALFPSAKQNGGISWATALAPPTITPVPILQNWWIGVRPPITTKSPHSTWPAKVTPFAKIELFPITQSWATWTYPINKLLFPITVLECPVTVPGLNKVYSLILLLSPIINSTSSFGLNFKSCGIVPIEACEKIWLFLPIVVFPAITVWESITVPSPIFTSFPIIVYAPTVTFSPKIAPSSIMAVLWILLIFDLNYLSTIIALNSASAVSLPST